MTGMVVGMCGDDACRAGGPAVRSRAAGALNALGGALRALSAEPGRMRRCGHRRLRVTGRAR